MFSGLIIAKANPPYSPPSAPLSTISRDSSNNVVITWAAVANTRGYSIERSTSSGGTYTVIAEHLVSTAFTDTIVGSDNAFYKINAHNGEGVGTSLVSSTLGTSAPVTSSPSNHPTTPAPFQSPTSQPTNKPITNPPSRSPTPQVRLFAIFHWIVVLMHFSSYPPKSRQPTDKPITNSPSRSPVVSPCGDGICHADEGKRFDE